MARRIDLNDLRLLMKVVEHGSYSAAARATGVPKSTVSQRIAALEASAGIGLLRRTSRSLFLTAAGAQLLPLAQQTEHLAQNVEQWLEEQGTDVHGTLRLSCSAAIAQFALSPIVPRFLAQHDRVIVRVESCNRLVDLVSEGFDMTLRGHVGPLKDSTLRQRVVARTPWALAASPAWLKRHGPIDVPGDVPKEEALYFSTTNACDGWALTRGDELTVLQLAPRLISDDMISLRTSTISGGGVTCLPSYLMRNAFESGELVRLLPEWSPQTSTISVLTPPKAQSSRLAGVFSDFLAAELPKIVLA